MNPQAFLECTLAQLRNLTAVAMVVLMACSATDPGRSVSWSELGMERLELDLIDDGRHEVYRFIEGGYVTATIGQRGGAVVGPLLYWRVDGDHLVLSKLKASDTIFDFHQPRLDGDTLHVRRGSFGRDRFRIRRDA